MAQITVEPAGEQTLIGFYKQMASELGEVSSHLLNVLARSITERGWLHPLAGVVERLVDGGDDPAAIDAAIADLVHRRLLELDEAGERIVGLLGTVSIARTPHRGHLANGVDIFTRGGADLLSLPSMFVRSVDAFTACGQCSADVHLVMEGDAITDVSPTGIAGFIANWDGQGDLTGVSERSPLFCSDACLSAWQEAHAGTEGLPLSSDTLLFIGPMVGHELGAPRFEMVKIEG